MMAYVSSAQNLSGFGLAASLGAFLARWKDARSRRATYLRVFDELSAMTDRDLADINLHRVQIRDIAQQAAYGR
jgi:uncharacterized protein YjiS (DUF1127 family)